MAVLLIPSSLVLIGLAIGKRFRTGASAPPAWRESLLLAAVTFGLLLTAVTEILGIFKSITPTSVMAAWALVSLGAAACLAQAGGRLAFPRLRLSLPSWHLLCLLGCSAVPVAITGLIAVVSPPNNWDSIAYHMGRIVHWMQNQSVAFYPTHVLRQLHMNPWGEYAILHLQILSGGDRFANLVQWSCMAGSLVGVSLIARRLGAGSHGQALAAALAATLPMGILQATSTQTDHVVGFWLVCFVYFALSIVYENRMDWATALGAGGALALAVLSKATAYILALPFLLWFVVSLFAKQRLRCWKLLAVIAAIVVSVNLGHYWRNFDLYGSPLGVSAEGKSTYYNQVISVPSLISNVVRNTALHLETPFPQVNALTTKAIFSIHDWIGADASDIRTSWAGLEFTRVTGMARNDSSGGNLVHLCLIVASTGVLLLCRRFRRERILMLYAGCLVSAFLIFCGYLKWQPWNSRLHLPLFVLWAPLIAIVAERLLNRRVMPAIAAMLVILASPWMVHNLFRPLIGQGSILRAQRVNVYFYNRPQLRPTYLETAAFLSANGCSQIGLIGDWDTWEYPLWVVLRNASGEAVRIEHVAVQNASGQKLPAASVDLCGIVSFYNRGEEFALDDKRYAKAFYLDPIYVYLRR